MTVVEALGRCVERARAFRYIPDAPESADWLTQAMADRFATAEEVEARGGDDCDGLCGWTIERGMALADGRGSWRLVLGRVLQQGVWLGHAWVEVLDEDGRRWWADPTWGWPAADPQRHGFPAHRQPSHSFMFDGLIYGAPMVYGLIE